MLNHSRSAIKKKFLSDHSENILGAVFALINNKPKLLFYVKIFIWRKDTLSSTKRKILTNSLTEMLLSWC